MLVSVLLLEHAGPVPRGAGDARKLYLHGPAPPRTGAVAPALYVVSLRLILVVLLNHGEEGGRLDVVPAAAVFEALLAELLAAIFPAHLQADGVGVLDANDVVILANGTALVAVPADGASVAQEDVAII